jgi:hypothetical protein
MLVKAENVTSKKLKKKFSDFNKIDCEKDWKSLNKNIIEDIESRFKFNKQQMAKNLAKFMLKSKHFCISKDGRSIMIKDQPKTALALLDYLSTAIRLLYWLQRKEDRLIPITRLDRCQRRNLWLSRRTSHNRNFPAGWVDC